MLEIQYQIDILELASASLDFLEHRPLLRFSLFCMKILCFIIIGVYTICVYNNNIFWSNTLVAGMAVIWLLYRRRLNYYILCRVLTAKQFNRFSNTIKLHKHKLTSQINNFVTELHWSKIPYIYKNKDGYIIPIPGLSNGGRFVWLPYRSFKGTEEENIFLGLLQNYKLKVKPISLTVNRKINNR